MVAATSASGMDMCSNTHARCMTRGYGANGRGACWNDDPLPHTYHRVAERIGIEVAAKGNSHTYRIIELAANNKT